MTIKINAKCHVVIIKLSLPVTTTIGNTNCALMKRGLVATMERGLSFGEEELVFESY